MSDLLSSIGIMLVFLGMIFNAIQSDVDELLATEKPPVAQEKQLEKFRNKILKCIWTKCLPVFFVFAFFGYLLLPRSLGIMQESELVVWKFDELNTLFVFINAGLFGFAAFTAVKTYQLIKVY